MIDTEIATNVLLQTTVKTHILVLFHEVLNGVYVKISIYCNPHRPYPPQLQVKQKNNKFLGVSPKRTNFGPKCTVLGFFLVLTQGTVSCSS